MLAALESQGCRIIYAPSPNIAPFRITFETPQRERRPSKKVLDEPLFEVLIGGTADKLLRLVRFEREAWGEEPGERHYLAEHFGDTALITASRELLAAPSAISQAHLHALAKEFD